MGDRTNHLSFVIWHFSLVIWVFRLAVQQSFVCPIAERHSHKAPRIHHKVGIVIEPSAKGAKYDSQGQARGASPLGVVANGLQA